MRKFNMESVEEIIKERAADFVNKIITYRKIQKDSYMNALLDYASENNIEIETLGEIVKSTPSIMAALTEEAELLNLLPKTSRLEL